MVGMQRVFVVFPDHTHLLFVRSSSVLGMSWITLQKPTVFTYG